MSGDPRTVRHVEPAAPDGLPAPAARTRRGLAAPIARDSQLAVEIRGLVEHGALEQARERFGELVTLHQRRASRIAYQYLRDVADADEAVQDAFVKVFAHITSYRETWPFEVWFTRILINGCLDRRKARMRRDRWFVSGDASAAGEAHVPTDTPGNPNPEQRVLARERRGRIAAAVNRLEGRQRTVFVLCHYGGYTPREISVMTGLNESTVRVHLFRAARKLRGLLGGKP